MLRAIIFDFDGIIADTEPTHLEAFKKVLKDIGISLTNKDYYDKYLAFDDKTLFNKILDINDRKPDENLIDELVKNKNILITELLNEYVILVPGFLNYLQRISEKYLLAIASGALRSEILLVLKKFNIDKEFHSLTTADDVVNCKPNPEVFIKSLNTLNEISEDNIEPGECLVIEDSIYGIKAAKSAGMKCLAITHTYSKELLNEADLIVNNFDEIDLNKLENLFS